MSPKDVLRDLLMAFGYKIKDLKLQSTMQREQALKEKLALPAVAVQLQPAIIADIREELENLARSRAGCNKCSGACACKIERRMLKQHFAMVQKAANKAMAPSAEAAVKENDDTLPDDVQKFENQLDYQRIRRRDAKRALMQLPGRTTQSAPVTPINNLLPSPSHSECRPTIATQPAKRRRRAAIGSPSAAPVAADTSDTGDLGSRGLEALVQNLTNDECEDLEDMLISAPAEEPMATPAWRAQHGLASAPHE